MFTTGRHAVVHGSAVLVAGLLVVLVGVGAAAHPGGSVVAHTLTSVADLGDAFGAAAVLLALATFALLAVTLFPHRRRRSPDDHVEESGAFDENTTRFERFVAWAKVFALVALLVGAVLVAIDRLAQPGQPGAGTTGRRRAGAPTGSPPATTSGATSHHEVALGNGELVLIVVGAVLVLLVVLALLARARRRSLITAREEPESEPDTATELASVVDEAMNSLATDDDPRRAVIAAYAGMERHFSRRGLSRRASETPFEFVERSLEHVGAPSDAALALTALFERARFGNRVIDATLRGEASRALAAVRGATGVGQ